jgi:hypothetical protein
MPYVGIAADSDLSDAVLGVSRPEVLRVKLDLIPPQLRESLSAYRLSYLPCS